MEPPVSRIIVFSLTSGAHRKFLHGGVGPIIGDIINYGVTWSAVGAVYEWISISAILRIEHLPDAIFAY
jgi:hypothetical protein